MKPVRYAYAITGALLLGGAAATMTLQPEAGAQTAQNDRMPAAAAPRPGAPQSFADLVARLQPAVVNISTTQRVTLNSTNPFAGTPFAELFGGQQGGGRPVTRQAESLGSGFIISADGYIVTNSHVISAGNQRAVVETITVTLSDGREFTARLVARDVESDLAVLKIEGNQFPFVRLGNSGSIRAGDWAVAIGNPFGLGGSVTAGIISTVQRVTDAGAYSRFIQTDASINRGNSGGPLFDLEGNVIGINSQILSPTGGNVGIGFAIPADEARPIIDTLMKGGSVQRGYLGVSAQQITADIATALGVDRDRGELVATVQPGTPAARAGIRQGDVVVRIANRDVTREQSLSYLMANVRPGTTVPIELIRDGRRQTVNVQVAARPSAEELAGFDPNAEDASPGGGGGSGENSANAMGTSLGLQLQTLNAQIARSVGLPADARGVVILQADPSSDAAGKGLTRGDVITTVNRQPVANPADIARLVSAAQRAGQRQVLLYVQRGQAARFVAINIAQ